jgi:hypothetical protein
MGKRWRCFINPSNMSCIEKTCQILEMFVAEIQVETWTYIVVTRVEIHMDMVNLVLCMYTIISH